jgi:hypothetical protein
MSEYAVSTSANVSRAREVLERKIQDGRASALHLFEHANTVIPQDSIVRSGALEFTPGAAGVEVGFGDASRGIHKHALSQMAGKAGIPGAYLAELVSEEGWKRALAANILNEHFHKSGPSSRYLVRSAKEEVRGFLSDRFRRLDSRPLLEAFATGCQSVGAIPIDGHVTDTRIALKAVLPMIFEPVPGEALCLGIEWGNSDYGAAKHSVRAFILRLWCLNGATMEDSLAQVHLGGRLAEDIEFSQRTYQLDTKASVSALNDVVKGVLGPAKINAFVDAIAAADGKKVDWRSMKSAIAKKLLKSELQAVEAAYQSRDVVNLPAGQSVWRASNAISWIAGQTEDGNRKLELQRLAGEVLNGKRDSEREAA